MQRMENAKRYADPVFSTFVARLFQDKGERERAVLGHFAFGCVPKRWEGKMEWRWVSMYCVDALAAET